MTAQEAKELVEQFEIAAANSENVRNAIANIDGMIKRTAKTGSRSIALPQYFRNLSDGEFNAVIRNYINKRFQVERQSTEPGDFKKTIISW